MRLWYCICYFVGLFLSTAVFAVDEQSLPAGIVFEPAVNDLSMVYLRDLFGNVANLQGAPNLFIGTIIRLFNLGLISFVAGMAAYSIVYGSLLSATDGGGLAQKGVRPWMVMKLAGGAASLAPLGPSGYSFLQTMIIWVAVQGVGLADAVWERSMDYMTAMHGAVYLKPDIKQYDDLDTLLSAHNGVASIYDAAVCNRMNHWKTIDASGTDQSEQSQVYTMRVNNNCIVAGANCPCGTGMVNGVCFGSQSSPTKCGAFSAHVESSSTTGWSNAAAMADALRGMSDSIVEMVNSQYDRLHYICKQNPSQCQSMLSIPFCDSGNTASPDSCVPANSFVAAASNYYVMSKATRMMAAGKNQDAALDWMIAARDKGWMTAGYYYAQLMRNSRPISCSIDSKAAGCSDKQYALESITKVLPGSPTPPPTSASNSPVYHYMQSQKGTYEDLATDIIKNMRYANDPTHSDKDVIEDPIFDYATAMLINNLVATPMEEPKLKMSWTLAMFGIKNISFYNIINAMTVVLSSFSGIQISKTVPVPFNQEIEFNPNCSIAKLTSCAPSNKSTYYKGCLTQAGLNRCLSSDRVGILSALYHEKSSGSPGSPLVTVAAMGQSLFEAGTQYIVQTNLNAYNMIMKMAGIITGIKAGTYVATAIIAGVMAELSEEWAGYFMSFAADNLIKQIDILYDIGFNYLTMFIGVGTTIAIFMYGMGATLSLYLPLVPFIIYTLVVVGWLMVIIEAMVSAPVISLGLAHPAYQQFLGAAEQAVMLLFLVLIRPAIALIGLMMSIMLAHVSMRLLNYAFMFLLGQTFEAAAAIHMNSITSIAVSFGLLITYVYSCYLVLNYCFQIMNFIPEQMSRWLGGGTMPLTGGDVAGMTMSIQRGVEKSVSQASQGAVFGIRKVAAVDTSLLFKSQSGGKIGLNLQGVIRQGTVPTAKSAWGKAKSAGGWISAKLRLSEGARAVRRGASAAAGAVGRGAGAVGRGAAAGGRRLASGMGRSGRWLVGTGVGRYVGSSRGGIMIAGAYVLVRKHVKRLKVASSEKLAIAARKVQEVVAASAEQAKQTASKLAERLYGWGKGVNFSPVSSLFEGVGVAFKDKAKGFDSFFYDKAKRWGRKGWEPAKFKMMNHFNEKVRMAKELNKMIEHQLELQSVSEANKVKLREMKDELTKIKPFEGLEKDRARITNETVLSLARYDLLKRLHTGNKEAMRMLNREFFKDLLTDSAEHQKKVAQFDRDWGSVERHQQRIDKYVGYYDFKASIVARKRKWFGVPQSEGQPGGIIEMMDMGMGVYYPDQLGLEE